MGINNIKHDLNCIARRMAAWADDPLTDDDAGRKRIVIKQDAQSLREFVLTLKDPDLYIGDRPKAAIAAGVPRVHEGSGLSEGEKEFSHGFNEDELGVLYMLRARREVFWQATHDWKATGGQGAIPAWEDFGIDGRESNFLGAVHDWLKGGEIGPRPQKSDYGL